MSKSTISSIPFEVFVCFAPEDEELRDQLEKQLHSLKRQELIITQDHRSIGAGIEVEVQIEKYINEAHIILLLLSSSFFNLDQCYSNLEKAVKQHQAGKTRTIPIILKPVEWKNTPISMFEVLPTDAIPVTKWSDNEEAFFNIFKGIREVVNGLFIEKYKKEIAIYEKEIENHSNNHVALRKLASVLVEMANFQKANFLKEEAILSYEKAIAVYNKLIELQPNSYIALREQGSVLEKLNQPEEAAASYEKALDIKPNDYILLSKNGSVQEKLGRHDKAITSYNKILELNQDNYIIWTQRGTILINLGRYKEAIDSYNRALKIKPNYRAAKYHQRLAYRKIMDQH